MAVGGVPAGAKTGFCVPRNEKNNTPAQPAMLPTCYGPNEQLSRGETTLTHRWRQQCAQGAGLTSGRGRPAAGSGRQERRQPRGQPATFRSPSPERRVSVLGDKQVGHRFAPRVPEQDGIRRRTRRLGPTNRIEFWMQYNSKTKQNNPPKKQQQRYCVSKRQGKGCRRLEKERRW